MTYKKWYLLALLFGFFGGLISYVAIKDKDDTAATECLWLGGLITVIPLAIYFLIVLRNL